MPVWCCWVAPVHGKRERKTCVAAVTGVGLLTVQLNWFICACVHICSAFGSETILDLILFLYHFIYNCLYLILLPERGWTLQKDWAESGQISTFSFVHKRYHLPNPQELLPAGNLALKRLHRQFSQLQNNTTLSFKRDASPHNGQTGTLEGREKSHQVSWINIWCWNSSPYRMQRKQRKEGEGIEADFSYQ